MEELKNRKFKRKLIKCCSCGAGFYWEPGEQLYYLSKGLSEPKRCPSCRQRRKKTLVPDWEVRQND